jgi:hypothetical protein
VTPYKTMKYLANASAALMRPVVGRSLVACRASMEGGAVRQIPAIRANVMPAWARAFNGTTAPQQQQRRNPHAFQHGNNKVDPPLTSCLHRMHAMPSATLCFYTPHRIACGAVPGNGGAGCSSYVKSYFVYFINPVDVMRRKSSHVCIHRRQHRTAHACCT